MGTTIRIRSEKRKSAMSDEEGLEDKVCSSMTDEETKTVSCLCLCA